MEDISKVPLTNIQKSYFASRNEKNNLGGVACHVYLETEHAGIDINKLSTAWGSLFKLHPRLSMYVTNDLMLEYREESPSKETMIFDLSALSKEVVEKELAEIREAMSNRMLCVSQGMTSGLIISKLPNNLTRIHFDLDLLSCDVVGFQIILRDLARIYNGKLVTYQAGTNRCDERGQKESEKYWNNIVQSFPGPPELMMNRRPEYLSNAKYTPMCHRIGVEDWNTIKHVAKTNNFSSHMIMLALFASVIGEYSKNKNFILNVPLFSEDVEQAIGDNTKLILLDIAYEPDLTLLKFIENCSNKFTEYSKKTYDDGFNFMHLLKSSGRYSDVVAPIVFSATPQIQLLDELFVDSLGDLKYIVSQTPNVWIDAQIYEISNELLIVWMVPDLLFKQSYVDQLFNTYLELVSQVSAADFLEKKLNESIRR